MSYTGLHPESAVLCSTAVAAKHRLHLSYVDGFRGMAALFVVLNHAWLQTWPKPVYGDTPTGWAELLTGWLEYGHFAVTFFIAISGFCLMLPALNNQGTLGEAGVRRFLLRRARRILPPYYVAVFVSIALTAFIANRTHSLYDISLPITMSGVISHLALVHNLHESTASQINAPLWTIAVECQIYLLFPLLVAARRRLGMQVVLFGTFFVSIVFFGPVVGTPFRGLSPHYLFVFAMGMYAAELAVGPRKQAFLWTGSAAAFVMLGMFQFAALRTAMITDLVVGLVGACLLVICAHWPQNMIARVTQLRPIVGLGMFSYSIYLVHFPIQQILWEHAVLPMQLGKFATFTIMSTAGTILTLMISYFFYLCFERPFCSNASGWPRLSELVRKRRLTAGTATS